MITYLDTETDLIQPGLLAPPMVCLTWTKEQPTAELLSVSDGVKFVYKVTEAGDTLVGANIAYDLAVVCAVEPALIPAVFAHYERGLVRDVQVRQRLLDIEAGCLNMTRNDGTKGYSLGALIQHYTGQDRSAEKSDPNGWRLRFGELKNVPIEQWPAEPIAYAKEDALSTRSVYLAQPADVVDELPQTRAAWSLHLMAAWGIRSDAPWVEQLKASLLKAQKANQKWLHKAKFYKPRRATKEEVLEGNVDYWEPATEKKAARPIRYARDMKRIQDTVWKYCERRGMPVPLTDSGRISTDKDTLERTGSRILQLLADGGGVDKILQTYLPALELGTVVPITSRPNTIVESGRTSWSQPNLQNLPTGKRVGGVRECFIPRPGFVFVSADYGSAELRAQAQNNIDWFGHSKLAELFKEGKDPLVWFASEMSGLPYEQIDANYKNKASPEKKARDAAKVAMYGLPGGLGAETLKTYARNYGLNLTSHEARELKATWFRILPEMKAYLDTIAKITRNGAATIQQHVSKRRRGNVDFCAAANSFFQARVADAAKAAMFRISHECYVDLGTALYGSRPIVFVHDEFVLESPTDIAHEAAERLVKVMVDQAQPYMPDVPVTAEVVLMPRWYKDAKVVRDATGRLIPWEPKTASTT